METKPKKILMIDDDSFLLEVKASSTPNEVIDKVVNIINKNLPAGGK